jgi:hypothetical protein
LLVAGVPRAITDYKNEDQEIISIANEYLELKFFDKEKGFGLNGIVNLQTNYNFLSEIFENENLWEIKLKHTSNDVKTVNNNNECVKQYEIEKSNDGNHITIHMYWRGISLTEEEKDLDVHTSIMLDNSFSYWRIDVENRSNEYGIWEIIYPVIRNIKASEYDSLHLAYPRANGILIKNPINSNKLPINMQYPSAKSMLQMSTVYEIINNNGLFLAAFDPNAYIKKFSYDIDQYNESLRYDMKSYPITTIYPYHSFVGHMVVTTRYSHSIRITLHVIS